MRILNLYSGLGGNRKLWGEENKVVAVEIDPLVASLYRNNFHNDTVTIGDAHKFLLEHFQEFDFIWSSPPCPSHSRVRKSCAWKTKRDGTKWLQNKPIYPSMILYEEIIFLDGYFRGKYCVENVVPYYAPLIEPQKVGGHLFWANFEITPIQVQSRKHFASVQELEGRKGFCLDNIKGVNKKLLLRNCVEPEVGKHILECAFET